MIKINQNAPIKILAITNFIIASNHMSKTILLLALVAAALAGDNLTIITNCTKCAENGTKDCFYLNGGPFNQF